jgi:hypothetical protein
MLVGVLGDGGKDRRLLADKPGPEAQGAIRRFPMLPISILTMQWRRRVEVQEPCFGKIRASGTFKQSLLRYETSVQSRAIYPHSQSTLC